MTEESTTRSQVQAVKDALRQVLHEHPEVLLAYLFGSTLTGEQGPMSDVDLAVLLAQKAPEAALQATLAHRLGQRLGIDRMDVVLLDRAPIELAYTVICDGICLYEVDRATRVEYEARVLSLYFDYLPVRRGFTRDIREGKGHERRVQRYREALRRTERTLGEIRASHQARSE